MASNFGMTSLKNPLLSLFVGCQKRKRWTYSIHYVNWDPILNDSPLAPQLVTKSYLLFYLLFYLALQILQSLFFHGAGALEAEVLGLTNSVTLEK